MYTICNDLLSYAIAKDDLFPPETALERRIAQVRATEIAAITQEAERLLERHNRLGKG